jgi:hypothetical protein
VRRFIGVVPTEEGTTNRKDRKHPAAPSVPPESIIKRRYKLSNDHINYLKNQNPQVLCLQTANRSKSLFYVIHVIFSYLWRRFGTYAITSHSPAERSPDICRYNQSQKEEVTQRNIESGQFSLRTVGESLVPVDNSIKSWPAVVARVSRRPVVPTQNAFALHKESPRRRG